MPAVCRALREERNLQQAIFEKYRDQQADLDAQINSIFEERTRVKGLQVLHLLLKGGAGQGISW